MAGYAGTGLATLVRQNRQVYLFYHELNLMGVASIAIQPERNRLGPPPGVSFQIYFTDASGHPADPGGVQIDIQDSDIDEDSKYCLVAAWQGPMNANYVGRVEISAVLSKYVRVFVKTLMNPVYATIQASEFSSSGGGSGSAGVGPAPSDGKAYGQDNGVWVPVVKIAGDTMTGPLVLPADPTLALQASTKQYVDNTVAANSLWQGVYNVTTNTPDLSTVTKLNNYSWTATTQNPLVPEPLIPNLPGLPAGTMINNDDKLVWSQTINSWHVVVGSSLTKQEADAIYVDLVGDTMQGPLLLAADPTVPLGTATKQYVDASSATVAATKVSKAGDTMTGLLVLSGDPAVPLGSATKQYVDNTEATINANKVSKAGDTMTGFLTLSADPSTPLQAATKSYVDAGVVLKVAKAGDTMTGPLVLPADPTTALQAATKQYVDNSEATLNANKVAKAGDTMTGLLVLSANPAANLGAATKQYVDAAALTKVNRAGDTMTGFLTLNADPTASLEAATKQYVDQAIASGNLYQGIWQVASNVPNLLIPPNAPLNGYSWVAQTVVPGTPETATGAIPGIGGMTIFNGDVIRYSTSLAVYQRIQGSSLTAAQADANYVNVTGDAMTGNLLLANDPTTPLMAATKQYVDAGDAVSATLADSKVAKVGDTMTGPLVLPGDPTANLQAATKQYVDAGLTAAVSVKVNRTGDTMTGALVLAADPTVALGAATKQYADSKVTKTGDTMTGALTLPADPTTNLQAATKQYVDNQLTTGLANKVAKAGDTMTGALTLPGNPTTGLQATTKTYVDSSIAAASLYQGTWQVAANTPNLNVPPNAPLNGYSWIAQTANPNTPETAPASVPGIGGQLVGAGTTVRWNNTTHVYELILGGGLTQTVASTLYVNKTGDTMTGQLGITSSNAAGIILNKTPTSGQANYIHGETNSALRWSIYLGNQSNESGSSAGSDFNLYRWSDTGTPTKVMEISRSAGAATIFPTLSTNLSFNLDNEGVFFFNGGAIYKKTNPAGVVIRQDSSNTQPAIENNDGTNSRPILDSTSGVLKAGDTMTGGLAFANVVDSSISATDKHVTLWGTPGNNFGFGITSGRLNYNTAATSNTHNFMVGGIEQFNIGSSTINILSNNLVFGADNTGVFTNGGGAFYKKSGSGMTIRQHANNTQPGIENNDGSNHRDIIDTINGDARYVNKSGDVMTGTGNLETHELLTRNGGPSGSTSVQIRMGYNNQAGATYGHEIRTAHDGSTAANNVLEFWLWGGSSNGASSSAPNAKVLALSATTISPNVPFANTTFNGYALHNLAANSVGLYLQKTDTTIGNYAPQVQWRSSDNRALADIRVQQVGAFYAYATRGAIEAWTGSGGYGYNKAFWTTAGSTTNPDFNVAGDVYARGVKLTSDLSLKQDVRPVSREETDQAFAGLRPMRYRWKSPKTPYAMHPSGFVEQPPGDLTRVEWGFIAGDIKTGAPDLIHPQDRVWNRTADDEVIDNPVTETMETYDLAGVLAIAIAKIRVMEEEINELKRPKKSFASTGLTKLRHWMDALQGVMLGFFLLGRRYWWNF